MELVELAPRDQPQLRRHCLGVPVGNIDRGLERQSHDRTDAWTVMRRLQAIPLRLETPVSGRLLSRQALIDKGGAKRVYRLQSLQDATTDRPQDCRWRTRTCTSLSSMTSRRFARCCASASSGKDFKLRKRRTAPSCGHGSSNNLSA